MGYWLKLFKGGETIRGTDNDVSARVVSWSKSKSDDMMGAVISHNDLCAFISGPGEYWQSDTIETIFPSNKSYIIKRRIEKLIASTDKTYSVLCTHNYLAIQFGAMCSSQVDEVVSINDQDTGKWLVAEFDVRTYKFKYYISDCKV